MTSELIYYYSFDLYEGGKRHDTREEAEARIASFPVRSNGSTARTIVIEDAKVSNMEATDGK